MSDVVLVTGSETLTGRKLIEKLLAQGCHVVAPVAGKETNTAETANPNLTVLTWNRSSWFSTKAIVRETIRKLGDVNAAWILYQRPSNAPNFANAGGSDIENVLEQSVKSNIALVREVLPLLESSGGFLGMVVPHRGGGTPGALEELSYGAFVAFAESLIRDSTFSLWCAGFVCKSPDADGFTTNLIRLEAERSKKLRGSWYRYPESRWPFGGSSITKSML